MDKQTSIYRKGQLDKVKIERPEYNVKVKFIHPYSGETYYMDITSEEFEKIKNILTGKEEELQSKIDNLYDSIIK